MSDTPQRDRVALLLEAASVLDSRHTRPRAAAPMRVVWNGRRWLAWNEEGEYWVPRPMLLWKRRRDLEREGAGRSQKTTL